MDEIKECGIGFLIIGILLTYFTFKNIKKYRKEKYNPFKDKDKGIQRVLNVNVYFKSYFGFIIGLLSILLSIIMIFFL